MLILLRDAFIHDLPVSIEYEIGQGKRNGVIFRVQLRKTGPFL
jgi:hypothetical protein